MMNKKKNTKGCGSSILGTLIVIAAVIIFAVISSLLSRFVVTSRFGEDAACALLTFSFTAIFIAFILFEAVFIVWQIKLSAASTGNAGAEGKMARLLKVLIIAIPCIALAVAVFGANTYTDCRENSISKVCFVTVKEYRWDERNDVLSYSFSCDSSGGLTFKINMKDGETIDLLGNVTSVSEAFSERFDADTVNLLGYAAHLSDKFDNGDYIITKKINGFEYMEKYYKNTSPEIWECIEKIAK